MDLSVSLTLWRSDKDAFLSGYEKKVKRTDAKRIYTDSSWVRVSTGECFEGFCGRVQKSPLQFSYTGATPSRMAGGTRPPRSLSLYVTGRNCLYVQLLVGEVAGGAYTPCVRVYACTDISVVQLPASLPLCKKGLADGRKTSELLENFLLSFFRLFSSLSLFSRERAREREDLLRTIAYSERIA